MARTPPIVLTIAGFDPSSGAGVTADIKTIAAHECYGVSCITALTVQSTRGVDRVEPVDPALVTETLEKLLEDVEVASVHIGMLGSAEVAGAVAMVLENHALPHVVLDPILNSTSGASLLEADGFGIVKNRLLSLAEVVTPNLEEAGTLTALEINDVSHMREAANALHALGARNVVVTGGHLDKAIDLLSMQTTRGVEQETFKAERQKSSSTHGTGCAFATALACHLAHERGLPEAVLLAKAYVSAAISNAHPLGHGNGPLHHLYRMAQSRRPSVTVLKEETSRSRN